MSLSMLASAQEVGHVDYKMGRKPIISITNFYGPITVKASQAKEVNVTYTSYARSVSFENQRYGNRISLVSASDSSADNLAEYSVLVPAHSFLNLFARGPIHVEGLAGDLTIQTASHPVVVENLDGAYIHVKTLDGPVTLRGVYNGHVFVQAVSGSINISDTRASWVDADSNDGRITYDGDPGSDGNYRFTSHSGDVDVSIPATALVEIQTNGQPRQKPEEAPTERTRGSSLFVSPANISRAHFELRSFMGKVRLIRPQPR
jgi:hypothetical protein